MEGETLHSSDDIPTKLYNSLLEESQKELVQSKERFCPPSYIPPEKTLRLNDISRIIEIPTNDNTGLSEENGIDSNGFVINDEINREGYSRLEDGSIYVCVHTPLDFCSGPMVNWWFKYVDSTPKYVLWHPVDHISGTWNEEYLARNIEDRNWVGNSHIVDEYVGGILNRVHIDFQPVIKYFESNKDQCDHSNLEIKFKAKGITSCIMGRINVYDPIFGDIAVGHLCHIVIEDNSIKPNKCKMISRFWLGDISSNIGSKYSFMSKDSGNETSTPRQVVNIYGHGLLSRFLPSSLVSFIGNSKMGRYLKASNKLGIDVYKHCYEEMRCLNKVLPQLYQLYNKKKK